MDYQLPVLVVNSIILLPYNELRLEIDSNLGNHLLKAMELINDDKLFVVTKSDPLEEAWNINDLPRIGVVAELIGKLELPNGKLRIALRGLERATCINYSYTYSEVVEASLNIIHDDVIETELNTAVVRKVKKEIDSYIKMIPSISNSVISQIDDAQSIGMITDIIVYYLNLSIERKRKYLENNNPLKRTEMILEDIYQEEALAEIEKRIDNKVKTSLEDHEKDYILREKMKLIQEELGEIPIHDKEIYSYEERLSNLVCSSSIKKKIQYEINRYKAMSDNSPEIGIVRSYIECLLSLPWDYETKDTEDFKKVKENLDKSHYGLNDVKERIIEYLAVKKYSNNSISSILCLIGPPGTGKTSLARSIAQSIGRNFVKVSVGGVDDEAEINGHRKSYLGASPGRIIDGMRRSKSCNPVFLIDEIDKLSSGIKGDPASALLEVLDKEQNIEFYDNYLETEYDLSKVMFILTANSIENIPEPLLDRLEVIQVSGYTEVEKKYIAKQYIIPRLCKEHGLRYLKVYDQVIMDVIRYYTKESGVRELERQMAKMIRKIVTSYVVDHKKESAVLQVDDVETYLGKRKFGFTRIMGNQVGVVSALAYTPYGGEVLPIEVNYYPGTGKLTLTGSLGDVMKESAMLALSYIKSNHEAFGIPYEKLPKNDIHIHIPTGAIAKDGPSAGITLVTSLISAFTNLELPHDIAMTGEITLRGNILPVGGLKEKSLGAIRSDIKRIFIPKDNLPDVEELPQEVKDTIEFIPVNNYMEIYEALKEVK